MCSEKTGLTNVRDDNFSLDDIDDLPQFKVFPTGGFHIKLEKGLERKKVGEHDAEEARMTLVQVLETKDLAEGEEAPKPGDMCSTVFMRDNATALGKLKEFCAPIAKQIGSGNFGAIREASKGLEMIVAGKRIYDKDKDRCYFNIAQVSLV